MAKEKKVSVRDTSKYTTSSDDDSSDDEVDYSSLFKGFDRAKVEKINELIDALNEKDRLLEKQEDILYEEHDKFVSVQKSLALEIKRNEMLSSELSACHKTVSSLKSLNDELTTKLEGVNKFSSCEEHVVICDRCKDFDVDACHEHLISITKLNDEVASLNAHLKTCKINFDQLNFARDVYTIGRHPSIKDGLGFRREAKNLRACLDGCIWLGLSPQMQPAHVWMLGWSLGPGSTDARFLREPGSTHTPKTTVPREPGSSRARGCADAGKNGRAGAGGKRVGLPPHSRHHPAITGAPAAMLLARSPFVPVVPPFLTRLFLLTCFCQNLA
jgi:hypothetical protein